MLIRNYTSNWAKNFEDIAHEIAQELNGLQYQIEHIGSTSVPNLDAKPIIDIDIIYDNDSEFESIKIGLVKLGYYHNGNQGIEHREVFKRSGNSLNKVLDSIYHHLYVCPKGSIPSERHILMRNFLRKNDWARLKYQQMKYKLADMANQDRKMYQALKEKHANPFIDEIIEKEKTNT